MAPPVGAGGIEPPTPASQTRCATSALRPVSRSLSTSGRLGLRALDLQCRLAEAEVCLRMCSPSPRPMGSKLDPATGLLAAGFLPRHEPEKLSRGPTTMAPTVLFVL